MHIYEVLRRPLITEKNTILQEQGKYTFEVAKAATKPQIKEAVETAFKVKVTKVNIVVAPGKKRRFGRRVVLTPAIKKAVVTLEADQKIQFFEGV